MTSRPPSSKSCRRSIASHEDGATVRFKEPDVTNAGVSQGRHALLSPKARKIEVFLQPGEYFVGDASHRIRTILGSCVSVTLWSPLQKVGAMSHFLLPTRGTMARPGSGRARAAGAVEPDARYGDEALQLMLHELAGAKVAAAQCKAKVFGGGAMFPGNEVAQAMSVGRRNGEAARELLEAHGIELISESLFGEGHRQIVFDIETGNVWSRQIRPPDQPAVPGKRGTA